MCTQANYFHSCNLQSLYENFGICCVDSTLYFVLFVWPCAQNLRAILRSYGSWHERHTTRLPAQWVGIMSQNKYTTMLTGSRAEIHSFTRQPSHTQLSSNSAESKETNLIISMNTYIYILRLSDPRTVTLQVS